VGTLRQRRLSSVCLRGACSGGAPMLRMVEVRAGARIWGEPRGAQVDDSIAGSVSVLLHLCP
jgi:hypothetical protein